VARGAEQAEMVARSGPQTTCDIPKTVQRKYNVLFLIAGILIVKMAKKDWQVRFISN